jgi:Ca2+-binding EF-hand superfamily protein
LIISKKYDHIEDSFMDASGNTAKVDFASFMNFVDKHDALKGFNLTAELKQKLFAEIDPHKKSFVTLKDWLSAFGTFDEVDHIMVEFKNFVQS